MFLVLHPMLALQNDVPEGGGLAVGLLAAPALALVQRQVAHRVVRGAREVHICQLLESDATCRYTDGKRLSLRNESYKYL